MQHGQQSISRLCWAQLRSSELASWQPLLQHKWPLLSACLLSLCRIWALQQDCGDGKCCTPEGKYVAAQTVCKASKDPCTSDAKCSGTSDSCPSPKKAKDGSFCSHDPFGIFDAVHKKSITPEEAQEEGYHKCGQCSYGWCARAKSGKHGKGKHGGRRELLESEYSSDSKAAQKGHKHKGWVYCEERSEYSE